MINYIAQKKSLKKFNFFCFNIYRKKKQKKKHFFFYIGPTSRSIRRKAQKTPSYYGGLFHDWATSSCSHPKLFALLK